MRHGSPDAVASKPTRVTCVGSDLGPLWGSTYSLRAFVGLRLVYFWGAPGWHRSPETDQTPRVIYFNYPTL